MSQLKAKVAGAAVAAALALAVTMSDQGVSDLQVHEGVRLEAYADPYYGWRLPTICYGSTAGVYRGQVATLEECNQRLKVDIARAEKIVQDALAGTGATLTQGEQDAYVSFAFNTGYFKLQRNGKPTSMYLQVVAGNPAKACAALKLYNQSNGVVSKGLAKRRAAEYARCMKDLV